MFVTCYAVYVEAFIMSVFYVMNLYIDMSFMNIC